MNVAPGGLAGAFGALSLDGARPAAPKPAAAATRSVQAAPTAAAAAPAAGFEGGVFGVRAVTQTAKAEAATPPPNPNLPRGSLIDLKI